MSVGYSKDTFVMQNVIFINFSTFSLSSLIQIYVEYFGKDFLMASSVRIWRRFYSYRVSLRFWGNAFHVFDFGILIFCGLRLCPELSQ